MKKTIIILLCLLFSYAQSQIQRVEPMNWWIGMKHNTIQLLIYGEKISEYSVSLSYPNVTIQKTEKAESPNYLFVTLQIDDNAKAGKFPIWFKKNNKKIKHIYELKERQPNSANRQSFDNSDAVYLLVPDRFSNGNVANDSQNSLLEKANRSFDGGRHGGDIQGIVNHLDYIKEMGFTAIWSTPFLENNAKEYSYHGYGITDFYNVDARFGSNSEYSNYVQTAHSKGLKIIQDFIFNHTGINHWWMKDLPFKNWIHQFDKFTMTNHRKTVFTDPYVAQIDKTLYTDGWFVDTMPDINQQNPFLVTYLIQNTLWWIEFANIDGIRVDTYSYSDKHFLADWNQAIQLEYPKFNVVGEEWIREKTITSYYQKGKKNDDGYDSYLPCIMDFALGEDVIAALNSPNNWSSAWGKVYVTMSLDHLFPDPYNQMIFPDNHDMSRIWFSLKENFDHWKIAMSLFTTMRGTPQFLYGTEILMTNKDDGNHSQIRADFPGGWQSDNVNAFAGIGLTAQQKEAQQFMKKLLNFRKTADAIHHGKLLQYSPDLNDVYVYFRISEKQRIMVILNKNTNDVSFSLDRYKEGLGSATSGFDIISDQNIALSNELKIKAKSAMIIELK